MNRRIISIITAVVLVVVSLCFAVPRNTAKAATQAELQQQINELNGKISSYKSKLSSLESEKAENEEYLRTLKAQISAVEEKASNLQTQINALDNEIEGYNNQIKQLNNEISVIEDEIKATEAEIVETEDNIDGAKEGLSKQLKTAYIQGKESTLKILMGSDSLASFLTSLEMMKKASEAENKVINDFMDQVVKLKKAKDKLEKSKASLNEKKKEVEETKAIAVEKKEELTAKQAEYKATVAELEGDYSTINTYIAELDRNSALYKSYIANAQAEREKADSELDKVISQYYATSQRQGTTLHADNNPGGGGGGGGGASGPTGRSYPSSASWAWPLGSASCYISSGFGYRSASYSGNSFHGGIDIAGCNLQPIYASRAGTVITAVYGTTGYGRYVVIDHGDGFSTVYGHCSSLCVSAGQSVSKGQQIANVGSTGNSTGPHCHFEVRYNGEKQNPLNYVSKP